MTRLPLLLVLATCAANAAEPKPDPAKPPEGAIILFDGTNTDKWLKAKTTPEGCLIAGTTTRDKFADFQLHVEFMHQWKPGDTRGKSGNSGVYLQQRYEIQIINSHGRKPWKGGCGAIYQFKAPDTNQAKPPNQWQSYDITFHAPRWDGKKKIKDARITVVHNGVKVHDDVEVPRKTGHGRKEEPSPGPIHLQHHGAKVVFRNIWILPLDQDAAEAK